MRRSACALFGAVGLLLANPAFAQLDVTPASTNAATAGSEENEALKKQLKETQDRLHAFEADNDALRRRHDSSKQTIHTLTESLAVANA